MDNTIIIKIESGVVADVYATDPAQVIIVDYDMIEGDETFERRVQKAVLSTITDHCVNPDEIDTVVTSLVGDCVRPVRNRAGQDAAKIDKEGS